MERRIFLILNCSSEMPISKRISIRTFGDAEPPVSRGFRLDLNSIKVKLEWINSSATFWDLLLIQTRNGEFSNADSIPNVLNRLNSMTTNYYSIFFLSLSICFFNDLDEREHLFFLLPRLYVQTIFLILIFSSFFHQKLSTSATRDFLRFEWQQLICMFASNLRWFWSDLKWSGNFFSP